MGLDQYAYKVKKGSINSDVDFPINEGTDVEEICYWRKHPNLQGWMENLYKTKGGSNDNLNVDSPVRLNEQDITRLREVVEKGKLPKSNGFFWGNESDEHYKGMDLEFCNDALKAMDEGYDVFYSAWY